MGNDTKRSLNLRFRLLSFYFAAEHSPLCARISGCCHQRGLDVASDAVDRRDAHDRRSYAGFQMAAPALVDNHNRGRINRAFGAAPKSDWRGNDFLGPAWSSRSI